MLRWPMYVVFLGLVVVVACEGDDDTCALSGDVSGALMAELPGADVACLTQHSPGAGIDVEYQVLKKPIARVHLVIADITKGVIGNFPATVTVDGEGDSSWQSDACTVSISANDFRAAEQFGDRYLVEGDGACVVPLRPDTGETTVSLGPFGFVVEVTWAK